MERGTFRRCIGEDELVRRGRLCITDCKRLGEGDLLIAALPFPFSVPRPKYAKESEDHRKTSGRRDQRFEVAEACGIGSFSRRTRPHSG